MSTVSQSGQTDRPHAHGLRCGHIAVRHRDHVDYLENGHLQHVEGGRIEEYVLEVTADNPDRCAPEQRATGHDSVHQQTRMRPRGRAPLLPARRQLRRSWPAYDRVSMNLRLWLDRVSHSIGALGRRSLALSKSSKLI